MERVAVEEHAPHVRAEAERRGKVEIAVVAAAAGDIKANDIGRPRPGEIELRGSDVDVSDRECGPAGGNVGREGECMRSGIGVKTEEATQQRRHDHGCGPSLIGSGSREVLEVVAGENLGDVTDRASRSELGIGQQAGVAGKRAMIAILADGGPSGEERPDGTVVILAGLIFGIMRRNNARAPVGFEVGAGKAIDHGLGLVGIEQPEPHGNRGEDAGVFIACPCMLRPMDQACISGIAIKAIQGSDAAIEGGHELLLYVVFVEQRGQLREGTGSFEAEAALVQLGANGDKGTGFNPAVAETGILRESIGTPRRDGGTARPSTTDPSGRGQTGHLHSAGRNRGWR